MTLSAKSQERISFILGAIPFLAAGLITFNIGDWKFKTATLLLALYDLFAAVFESRMSILMKTFLWVTNALLSAIIAYDFSVTGREWLSYIWTAITACYLFALVLYRREGAKTGRGDASSDQPQP